MNGCERDIDVLPPLVAEVGGGEEAAGEAGHLHRGGGGGGGGLGGEDPHEGAGSSEHGGVRPRPQPRHL